MTTKKSRMSQTTHGDALTFEMVSEDRFFQYCINIFFLVCLFLI